jgi:hypothetical protein
MGIDIITKERLLGSVSGNLSKLLRILELFSALHRKM